MTLDQCINVAISREGVCLSTSYNNSKEKMKWQCKNGHMWEARFNDIKRGSWCRSCLKKTISECHLTAENHGGHCLTNVYINKYTKMSWKCHMNHIWQARYNDVMKGSWCNECLKGSIQECQEYARKRNGDCLSTHYKNKYQKLNWKCERGHTWEARFNDIKKGTWCPHCYQPSYYETLTKSICEKQFGIRPITNRKRIGIELDCYIQFNDGKEINFEIHGDQHYQYTPYFHRTPDKFKWQLNRDKDRRERCASAGIALHELRTMKTKSEKNIELFTNKVLTIIKENYSQYTI